MRTGIAALLVGMLSVGAVGCERPSEARCKQAVENINKIYGLATNQEADMAAAVRTCRAQSTNEAVDCMIAAKSKEDVEACEAKTGKASPAKPAEDKKPPAEDEKPPAEDKKP